MTTKMDSEDIFKKLHQLKLKLDRRLDLWHWLRWIYLLLPIFILILTFGLLFFAEQLKDANLLLISVMGLCWILFILITGFMNWILKNQKTLNLLFTIELGDINIPGMDWELSKLQNRANKGFLLLIMATLTFLLFLFSNIYVSSFPIIPEDFRNANLALISTISGFLILVCIGFIIFQINSFFDMSEIRGDYIPKELPFHSKSGILDFVESYLKPNSRVNFRYFRKAFIKVAKIQGELFFGQLFGLIYLFHKQQLVENWGQPKFTLDYDKLIDNVVQIFPREPFLENITIFLNIAQKRRFLDLVARLTSVQRVGTLSDDHLREILVTFLHIEPDGVLLLTFQKLLTISVFDRLLGSIFSEVGFDNHSLLCKFDCDSALVH
ncbi:MAG: hypothetical protein ACXAC7_24695 [Candidatus Hodarchaeales archaeon]|jgi:hypothetical protein